MKKIIAELEKIGHGKGKVNYRLRDAVFSRQRYWGEPFPIVHTADGEVHTIDPADLPLTLPHIDAYMPTADGRPPLARAEAWLNTTHNGQPAVRETNTMPQWAGSCWYYLRYMDPHNDTAPFSEEAEQYWGPVDLYIGGVEHAVLHLLYARFWHKVLYDCGLVHTKEPFKALFNQGMILAYSYQDERGKYYHPTEVEQRGEGWFVKGSDTPVHTQMEKMGKSKKNVEDPLDIVARYGADALRTYEMFMGPLDQVKPWQTSGCEGVYRFLGRVWRLFVDQHTGDIKPFSEPRKDVTKALHLAIKESTEGIAALKFNTPVSRMMELVNTAGGELPTREEAEAFILILSPYAPHLAEELWSRLGHTDTLAEATWPEFDPGALVEDTLEIAVQVMGKLRGTITISQDDDKDSVLAQAKANPNVARHLEGKRIIKEIFVPGRLVNFVAK